MITLDEKKDNSKILEYIYKVGVEFCPAIDYDGEGQPYIAGTNADVIFTDYYNKGEVDFLSYEDYLNDEEIQAIIEAFGLDKEKFYLLVLFITHYAKGEWIEPNYTTDPPYKQVEPFCNAIIKELKDINDVHAEFTDKATITLKIGKNQIIVDDAMAIAYIGSIADKMNRIIKNVVRPLYSKGYRYTEDWDAKEKEDSNASFNEQFKRVATLNICTYCDAENNPIKVDYNRALYESAFDLNNPFQNDSTKNSYLIGCFGAMFDYFFKDCDKPVRKSFVNQYGEKITISKYRLICKLVGLTNLTGNKNSDEEFLNDEGDKVKGYITGLKRAKISPWNKFYK